MKISYKYRGYADSEGLLTVSGAITDWVEDNYATGDELVSTSGTIIEQIPSLDGYATEGLVTTVSGDLTAWVEGSFASTNHDASHLTSGSDEIDADKLNVDFTPANYTPALVTDISTDLDDLSSHLSGIDTALSSVGSGSSDIFIEGTAGEALSQYDTVYLDPDTSEYKKAIHTGTDVQADAVGVVVESGGIAEDATGTIQILGEVTNAGWSFTEGMEVYVSSTVGALTHTKPTALGYYVKPMGVATDTTVVLVSPQTGWRLVAGTDDITEVDGDLLNISWNPTNSTPEVVGGVTTSVDDLTSHLKGIDVVIGTLSYIKSHYLRSEAWTGGAATSATTRRSLVSPEEIEVRIDDTSLKLTSVTTLDVNTDASWDFGQAIAARANSTAYDIGDFVRPATPNNLVYKCTTAGTSNSTPPTFGTTVGGTTSDGGGSAVVWTCYNDDAVAAKRAGVNYYAYACIPSSGTEPDLILSRNSTTPHGYTADNSRKVGGFHCLCVAAGTISGHTLTGYLAGDILPQSVWDLSFRSASENEGMVYDPYMDIWVDIYLQSGTSTSTASAYGGTIIDTRGWCEHVDDGAAVKKRLLNDAEFQIIAEGSNQETNTEGGNPVTAGGHVDTASRRMVSNIGCEDCTGARWQWLSDQSYRYEGVAWAYYDHSTKGSLYLQAENADVKLLGGGQGSRARNANNFRWRENAAFGCRFAARPRTGR